MKLYIFLAYAIGFCIMEMASIDASYSTTPYGFPCLVLDEESTVPCGSCIDEGYAYCDNLWQTWTNYTSYCGQLQQRYLLCNCNQYADPQGIVKWPCVSELDQEAAESFVSSCQSLCPLGSLQSRIQTLRSGVTPSGLLLCLGCIGITLSVFEPCDLIDCKPDFSDPHIFSLDNHECELDFSCHQ